VNLWTNELSFAVRRCGKGNFRALCRGYGISAKTGYKWQERFLRDGAKRDGGRIAAAAEPS
jgi:transposase